MEPLNENKWFGKVLITPQNTVLLHCTRCNSEYKIYEKFLAHIFAHHYTDERNKPNRYEKLVFKIKHDAEQPSQPEQLLCLEKENSQDEPIPTSLESQDDIIEEICTNITEELPDTLIPIKPPTVPNQIKQVKGKHDKSERTCPICGTVYKDKYIMRGHLVRHTNEKRFSCKECEMKFFTRTELTLHMRRHTGERPYICSYCGQGFKNTTALHSHERGHSNMRMHKCNICDKRFNSNYGVKKHMVVHTKEKNYVCNVCNGRFATRTSMLQHMLLHANTRKYVCNICNKAFKQKPALWSHKRNAHKLVIEKTRNGSTSDVEGAEFCKLCQTNFQNKTLLLEHHLQMHADEDNVATFDALEELESEALELE